MAIQKKYVTSINGKTGTIPYELDYMDPVEIGSSDYIAQTSPSSPPMKVIFLDAGDCKVNGSTGNTIPQSIQGLASSMRPMLLEQIDDSNDFVMHVESGIPYVPAV